MNKMSIFFQLLLVLLTQCFTVSLAISHKNITTDKFALLQLKAHITYDPDNIISSNWSSATPICSWAGVSCGARHHRVTALNLPNMNLSGSLPPHIGNLSLLASFNWSGNSFQGQLPPELGKLRRLKRLDFSDNLLVGSLPLAIYDIFSLQVLVLTSNNNLTGPLSRKIGNLTQLKELYVEDTNIRGELPQEMGNLHRLEIIKASNASFSGPIPPSIFNITALRWIYLDQNSLLGALPNDLCDHLPNLEVLYLYQNQLNGSIPSSIGKCKKLQNLALLSNRFTGYIPRCIGNLTRITEIDLSNNKFEGEIPQEVGNLPLSYLDVSNNLLIGSIPPMIFNISTLEIIDLSSNNHSGQLPSTLGLRLPKLTKLYLDGNRLSGRLPNFISNASLLVILDLSHNSFSGPLLNSLGDLRFLELLNLESNNMSTEVPTLQTSFFSSLTNCRFLTHLYVSSNSLGGVLPDSIGNLSTSLQYLISDDCELHGNIPSGIGNLSNLLVLSLTGNKLAGPIPATIGRLQQLQGLYLGSNILDETLPNALCHLKMLNVLNFFENLLNGSIPECISNLTSLRYLHLYSNKFNSIIPSTFWSLTDILEVNLASNGFSGSLPLDVGKLRVLTVMALSRNQLSGNIPSTIGDLKDLTDIFLDENTFEGSIPQSIGGFVNLQFLDLSNNSLSGAIPKSLEELSYLEYFNVSFNKLEGEIPGGGSFRNFSAESFMGNVALCGLARFAVPRCKYTLLSKHPNVRLLRYVLPPTLAALAMILVFALITIIRRKRKSKLRATDEEGFTGPVEWRRISYLELQQATNKFSESRLLGTGSFGSVYSGTLSDGLDIAIKVFNMQVEGALESFDTECEVVRNIRHRNLIKIISSCSNEDFKALVLEFMPNGTLEKWLHSDGYCLDILQRLNIMIDVASALEYLHHGYSVPIIHCDLKPSNVLLDEDMVAHVCDFGLTKLLGEGDSVMQTMRIATIGYMAPEYGSLGIVSAKGDVYCFAILLVETFTKRKPTDELFDGERSLRLWVKDLLSRSVTEVMDANLREEERCLIAITNCVSSVLELALNCSAEAPKERKNMKDVVAILNKIKKKYLNDARRIR